MKPPTDCYESFVSGEVPVMLRVEHGPHWAFPLAHILHLSHGDNLLTITFATHDVRVSGEHLEKLLRELACHRVSAIRPGKSADAVTIEQIEVISVNGE